MAAKLEEKSRIGIFRGKKLPQNILHYLTEISCSEKSLVDDNLASSDYAGKTHEILFYLKQKGSETDLYMVYFGGHIIGFSAVRHGWTDEDGERYSARRIFTVIDPRYQPCSTTFVRKELSDLEGGLETAEK